MNSNNLQDSSLKKTNKLDVNQIVLIILVTFVIVGVLFFLKFSDESVPTVQRNEATLLIDFGDTRRMFTGEVLEEMTILDALNASVTAGQIKLTYKVDSENNTEVKEINGHTSNSKNQFVFYVNSQKVDSNDLNKIHIKSGDVITIKFE